ncbi:MAG: hypothetical protein AAFO69_05120 [Bacteroidota bacterium]
MQADLQKKANRETPSINLNSFAEAEKKEESKQPEVQQVQLSNEPFDEQRLKEVWDGFITSRSSTTISDIELIVLKKPWKLLDNYEVELYLNSHVEIPRFEKVEQSLVQYVRRELNNGLFKVKPVIKEAELQDQLYTDRDKYEFMVKKNPHLKDLKDELGLDFEF